MFRAVRIRVQIESPRERFASFVALALVKKFISCMTLGLPVTDESSTGQPARRAGLAARPLVDRGGYFATTRC